MSLFKNTASQKVRVFAFDATTGLPKTGDAANITASISKDFGAFADLTDTSATEEDSTKAKGYYLFDISQTETNADDIGITGRSSTSNIVVVGAPARMATRPPNAGALSIDSSGRVDVIKLNGTSQTARDIGASVLLSSGTGAGQLSFTSGILKVDVDTIKTNPVVNAGTVTFPTGATLGTSTLTQTQVTGGAYALNNASFAFNAALDFTTTQKAATLARVTLVDTTTTNTDMRGTDSAALASAWTSTLATHLDAIYAKLPANAIADETLVIQATSAILSAVGTPQQSGVAVTLPSIPANWITSGGVAAGALNGKGDWLLSSSYTAPTNLTAAQIATGVWTTTTAGDFATASSPGKILATQLGGVFTTTSSSVLTTASLANAPGGGGNVTVGGYAAGQDPATLVLDAAASGHDTAGSIGQKINAAGGAADPLLNVVPGSYASGTAGYRLGQVGSGSVTYTGPVNPTTGTMTLTRGDDYAAADGRELSYAVPAGGGNPDLTGATVVASWFLQTVVIGRETTTALTAALSVTCTVTSPGTANQTVIVAPTATQTALLTGTTYRVCLVALLADGSRVTFARKTCTVIDP